jgi:hypothetical protein
MLVLIDYLDFDVLVFLLMSWCKKNIHGVPGYDIFIMPFAT